MKMKHIKRVALGIILGLLFAISPVVTLAYPEQGGFHSVQLIGQNGFANSFLVIDQTGTNGQLDIDTQPSVTTQSATNTNGGSATFHGTLTSMATATTSYVGFQWSYDDMSYGNTTPLVAQNALGAYSYTLMGVDSTRVIHYRALARNDVTNGVGSDYAITASLQQANNLLNIIPIIIGAIILLIILAMAINSGNGIIAIVVIGIIIIIGLALLQGLQWLLNSIG